MGSLCGKESPTPNPRNSLLPSFAGSGRTLGGGYGELDNGEQPTPPNARVAAAVAAEQRSTSSTGKGKLGAKLEQQKRKTQSQLLAEGAKKTPETVAWD